MTNFKSQMFSRHLFRATFGLRRPDSMMSAAGSIQLSLEGKVMIKRTMMMMLMMRMRMMRMMIIIEC